MSSPSPRKKRGAQSLTQVAGLPVAERIALYSLVVTAISVIIAAAPAYWSYECRSAGRFCEGSAAAPTISETVRSKVVDRLASSEGSQNFRGMTIRRAGYWPFGKRYDVIAMFTDGEAAIDSIPANAADDILAVQNNSVAAFWRSAQAPVAGSDADIDNEAQITAYFPPLLLKRTFSIGPTYGNSGGGIKISNLSYDANQKRILFDLVATDSALRINSNNNNSFYIGQRIEFKTLVGATIAIELTDDFHVKRAYDVANRLAYEQSQQEVEDCKKSASENKNALPGYLFACMQEQGDDFTVRDRTLKIFEWDGSHLNEVATQRSCTSCNWTLDKSHKTMFVTSDHAYDYRRVNFWLSVFQRPFELERTFFIKGDCAQFFPYEISYQDENTIRFQLTTDCSTVTISNRLISFRPTDQKGQKITAYYLLKLDAHGLPLSLVEQK